MLFKLGLFLIPFENFFFAPSSGWAAIAPIAFFIYFFSKFKLIPLLIKREKKIIGFLILMICWGFLICVFEGTFNFVAIKRTVYTLGLGIIFYFSFIIRYIFKKNSIKKDVQILIYGYLLSMIIGIIQWLSYNYNLNSIIEIIQTLSKRTYIERVQFTMTEPSFISFHVYGIILIIYIFFKKIYIQPSKLHSVVLIFFPILVLVIGKSTRFIVDTIIVLFICIIYNFFSLKKISKKIKLIILCMGIFVGYILFNNREIMVQKIGKIDSRIEKIYKKGIYVDASLASRYFRINASIKGYKTNLFRTFIGYGIGNMGIPLSLGYKEAREEYKNDYLKEVEALKKFNGHSLFCMYIKIISEYGLIFLLILLISLYSSTYLLEYLIIGYLLIQFDSYSFYSIWLYLFMRKRLYNKILIKKK